MLKNSELLLIEIDVNTPPALAIRSTIPVIDTCETADKQPGGNYYIYLYVMCVCVSDNTK